MYSLTYAIGIAQSALVIGPGPTREFLPLERDIRPGAINRQMNIFVEIGQSMDARINIKPHSLVKGGGIDWEVFNTVIKNPTNKGSKGLKGIFIANKFRLLPLQVFMCFYV